MELFVVGLVAAAGLASYAAWLQLRESHRPQASNRCASDPTMSTLRVGDFVDHVGRDYVVEEVIEMALMRASLYRLADGERERFLFARRHESEAFLLEAIANVRIDDGAQTIDIAGQKLERIATYRDVTLICRSRFGKIERHRVPVTEYVDGARKHLFAFSGRGFDMVLIGERVLPGTLALYPGD